MRVAYATTLTFVIWLIASLYWRNSHHVTSHTSYGCLYHVRPIHTNITNKQKTLTNNWKNTNYIKHIFFLATSPLQAPLVHKWNGDLSRAQRRTPIVTQYNTQVFFLCKMTYARSLDKTFDGVKDMETSQNKKNNI